MDVKLIMFAEDGRRRDFPIGGGTTTIGRKDDCDIRIPLSEVSRRHAELLKDEGGVLLKDLGAANGTYLNNRRISEEELEPGDQIIIGPVVFTVQINGEPGEDDILPVRTALGDRQQQTSRRPGVGGSAHVGIEDEEVDPIAALEALAGSSAQTTLPPDEDDDDDFR
jgi:pSer/pThr/pTyr-binding forkhead associated (FHA) protein